MIKNRKIKWLAVLAVLVLVLPAVAAAGPFDNLPLDKMPLDKGAAGKVPFTYSELYVLGNSLADVGNVFIYTQGQIPPYPYYEGRFSNGPNYTDYLAEIYGLLNDPFLAGGTNFAWGGARTSGGTSPSGLAQLDDYMAYAAENPPDEDALFLVYLGGNNMFDIIYAAGALYPDEEAMAAVVQAGVEQGMVDLAVILGGLVQAGAENIVVPNVPNMGQVPGASLPFGGLFIPLATAASQAWNMALETLLQNFDGQANIMRVDVYGFIENIVADPASFGLANATLPCLYEEPGGLPVICANPDEYLFWDLKHPTTVGHMLLADAIFDSVKGYSSLPAVANK